MAGEVDPTDTMYGDSSPLESRKIQLVARCITREVYAKVRSDAIWTTAVDYRELEGTIKGGAPLYRWVPHHVFPQLVMR